MTKGYVHLDNFRLYTGIKCGRTVACSLDILEVADSFSHKSLNFVLRRFFISRFFLIVIITISHSLRVDIIVIAIRKAIVRQAYREEDGQADRPVDAPACCGQRTAVRRATCARDGQHLREQAGS